MEDNVKEERIEAYEEISIKELIMTLYKNKYLIAIITLVILFISLVFSLYLNNASKEAQILIDINHTKIEEGKNPDGSAFDPYDIVAPFVLKDVIDTLDIKGVVSINDIRSKAIIEPLVPESIQKKREFLLEKEGETLQYHPDEFLLTITTGGKIDDRLAVQIANQIVDSYMDYFTSEYINATIVTNRLINFNTEDYDYADISNVLHMQLDDLIAFNERIYQMDQSFRSKETGFSFNEIAETVKVIDEIDLNRIDSLISSYKLTKDEERLRVYYEYMIEQLTLKKEKLASSSGVSNEMLDKLENSNQSIIKTLNGELSDERDSYFTKLILRSSDFGESTAEVQRQITYYERELNELEQGTALIDSNSSVKAEVVELINQTSIKIQQWIELSNLSASEFYEKLMTKAVRPLSPAEVYSDVNVTLNLAIGLVLGLMLGIFAAFMKAMWTDESKEVKINE